MDITDHLTTFVQIITGKNEIKNDENKTIQNFNENKFIENIKNMN